MMMKMEACLLNAMENRKEMVEPHVCRGVPGDDMGPGGPQSS